MAREVRRFDIFFADPNATYRAGDLVKGMIYLELAQEFKIKGVKLCLHGIARVGWDENKSYTKGSASKLSHKNMDIYLDETVIIFRKSDGGMMAPGRYDWTFSVRLPPYIPASYEGQHGRVQYWAKAVLERRMKNDMEFTKNFTVLGALDLNTEPDAKKSGEAVGEVMAGTMCIKTGLISGQLAVTKRGFVPAQNIDFVAKIHNQSTKKVNVRVVLSQQVTFRADKQVRRTNTMVKGVSRGDVPPGEEITWEEEIKNVPPVQPTKLGGGCKNIEVKYLLSLICQPSGPGRTLEVPVEVIIGTVPLRKTDQGTPMLTVKAAAKAVDEGGLSAPVQKPKASPRPQQRAPIVAASP